MTYAMVTSQEEGKNISEGYSLQSELLSGNTSLHWFRCHLRGERHFDSAPSYEVQVRGSRTQQSRPIGDLGGGSAPCDVHRSTDKACV